MTRSLEATALLQAGDPRDTTQVLLTGYEFVGAALGLFIAYQPYRGYKRNASRPMFFIMLGFVLIMGAPVLLTVPFLVVPSLPVAVVQAVTNTFEIGGLVCIIYALRVDA